MATLPRRALLAAAPAAMLAGCEPAMRMTASTTPRLDQDFLVRGVGEIAARARPGRLGVGLLNLDSGEAFLFEGERRFPMHGLSRLPMAAATLAEVDAGRVLLDERLFLIDEQLSPPPSAIAAAWPARRDFSAAELLEAALAGADNTAADVLMKRIGGPGAVTAWLTGRRVSGVHVDRYARELPGDIYAMAPFRPEWRSAQAFAAARASAPPATRLTAMRKYLADPRDSASPRGMVEFLHALDGGQLVSPTSSRRLVELMTRRPAGAGQTSVLPHGGFLAESVAVSDTDQGLTPAHNAAGIFRLSDKRAYAMAVFLAGSGHNAAERGRIFADISRVVVRGLA